MSGGRYLHYKLDCSDVDWRDHELNELWRDLTTGKEFSVRGYDGLLQSLDFYECGDIEREDYMEAVQRFKRKWFHKTPRNRVEFYRGVIQRCADELEEWSEDNRVNGDREVFDRASIFADRIRRLAKK